MNNQQLTFHQQQQLNPQVFFKQPATWSRTIIWALVSLTTCGIAWASVARIEKVIPATGKLEPKGAVKEIQAPVSGIVAGVYVEDGDRIEKGDLLLELDPTANSDLQSKIAANQQRIAQLDSQISFQQHNFNYHQLKSPVTGTVFELKVHSGFVAQPSEPLLEIVPDDSLTAQVYIPSENRGLVNSGMDVDVRIDGFDFSEFGDIQGKLIWVGADALKPNEKYHYPRYPAKIKLKQQTILANGAIQALESGMSVNVNIKERKRRVTSVFSGFLTKKLDSLKEAE